jgi:hypothetical protein
VEAAASHLKAIADLCSQHSLRCDVVLLPYEYQLRSNGDEDAFLPQDILTRRLRSISVSVLDPGAYFKQLSPSPSELFLFGDGIHLSEKGHLLLANYLFEHQTKN